MRMANTITITTITIKRQKRRIGPCLAITPCNGGHVIHTGLVAGEDHSFNQMIYMITNIVVNHCGFNLVDHCLRSHLSERCLKLPSVGGNCLPFKGAFSLPGSKTFLNFSFIHSHFVFQWSLLFDPERFLDFVCIHIHFVFQWSLFFALRDFSNSFLFIQSKWFW